MTRTTLLLLLLSAPGCFQPATETSLGTKDPGAMSNEAPGDAGAADAGALDAGTDAGAPLDLDAGPVITAPTQTLDLATCQGGLVPDGACATDGGCVTRHRAGVAAEVAADLSSLGATEPLQRGEAGGGGYLLAARGAANALWFVPPAGAPQQLEATGDASSFTDVGFARVDPSAGVLFYVVNHTTGATSRYEVHYALVQGTTFSGGFVATLPAAPVAAQAMNSSYLVATGAGVFSFQIDGGGRLFAADTGMTIEALAATPGAQWVLECPAATRTCQLVARSSTTGAQRVVYSGHVAGMPHGSLAAIGASVYLLDALVLLEFTDTRDTPRVVYRGAEFPQFEGTLKPSSLHAIGPRLYVGSVCYFDADAPGYSTQELDLQAGTARWLALDPAAPFVPWAVKYQSWEADVADRDEGTIFVVR